jgi:hypothetical protein
MFVERRVLAKDHDGELGHSPQGYLNSGVVS